MKGLLSHVRVDRNMPFLKRGMRCDMDNKKQGHVAGGNTHCNLQVLFDGETFSRNVHPKWQMTYYAPDGSVIADYKETI